MQIRQAVAATAILLGAACAPAAPAPPAASPTATGPTPTPVAAVQAGVGVVKGPLDSEAKALNGAGATFPAVLYSKWFSEYEKVTGVKVNYQAIGSGGGIKGISDMTVDFGASDAPLTDDQLKGAKGGELFHIPTALGAVVATYNVPEAGSTALKFSPETLAGIYLGTITKWNDPKVIADNPGVNLPGKDISTVHRSDGSGTTYAFTDYLSNVSPDWKSQVGTDTSVNWPNGLGGAGNQGVAGEVKQSTYSIGYVELIYALQNKLGVAQIKNKAGKFIEPNLTSVTAAAAASAGKIPADLRASIVNADGDTSYPISTFTYLLVYKSMTDKAKAQAVTRMAWWAVHDGQQFNTDLGYSPLPDPIVKAAEGKITAVTVNGQQAFPR